MPYCMKCFKKLSETDLFCPDCGTETWAAKKGATEEKTVEHKEVPKCFTIFGKIGHIIGIVTFILAFIPIVNIIAAEVAPIGIVFCILGKKDINLIDKCKRGLVFSILATILGIVLYIVYTVLFTLLSA